MPAYLQKAHNNLVTAEILVDNGFAQSSAHPAYFSVFLSLKYILAHFDSLNYDKQEEITSGKDSHYVLSSKALPIMATNDTSTGSDYFVWYNKLKKMRKQADYLPIDIEESLLKENLNVAKEFINNVDLHFKTK